MVTCPNCAIIYNTDKFDICPRCQEKHDFDNGPWKEK